MYDVVCPNENVQSTWVKSSFNNLSSKIIAPAIRIQTGQIFEGESAFDYLMSSITHSLKTQTQMGSLTSFEQQPPLQMAPSMGTSSPSNIDELPQPTFDSNVVTNASAKAMLMQRIDRANAASNFDTNVDFVISKIPK